MRSRNLRTRMSVAGATAVAMLALPVAGSSAAVAIYPAGGSGFGAGTDGWTGSGGSCALISGLAITCSTTAERSATEGNPPGSINSRIDVIVNLGGLLRGSTTWTSPDFTLPGGPALRSAELGLDRRLDGGGLVLDPASSYTVSIIDRGQGNQATPVLTETIGQADVAFGRKSGGVPAGVLVPGGTYALQIQTTTTTRLAQVGLLGSLNARYDNVTLVTDDGAQTGGPLPPGGGPETTPGVTVRGAPLSDTAAARLAGSVDPNAEVGRLAGGSLLASAQCTIVGTAKNDRIRGTAGNDVICGMGGNDRIDGGGGNDIVDTGNGNDTAGGGAGKDTLIGVRGKDRIAGGAGADRAGGGAGADRLNGGAGNDRVHGGSAKDRLAGGAGADRIAARDRTRDRVDGGSGRDSATVDRRMRAGRKGAAAARRRADRVRRVERISR